MTLDELQAQAEKDLKMDDLELATESLKSASLHQKYLNIYNNFRQLHLMNDGTYRVLYRKKWEYYGGKSDPQVYRNNPFEHKILKQDLSIYLESDEELIKQKQKVEYFRICMDSCERILKQIQSRGWDIKNAIEWRKFVDGNI
jgi:hypothetical protein|tara:strand:+ start:914 stop:1342 length:429 start_codon:yes stop_codon:yes gene_type:complete